MDLDEYQNKAMEYRLATANEAYALFNLAAEVGELLGLVAKFIRDGNSVGDEKVLSDKLKKELGDIMWMLAAVSADANLSLSEICTVNLAKLEDRKSRSQIKGSGDNR